MRRELRTQRRTHLALVREGVEGVVGIEDAVLVERKIAAQEDRSSPC